MSEMKPVSSLTQAVNTQLGDLMAQGPSQDRLNEAYRLLAKWRSQLIGNTIVKRQGTKILNGPFSGMDYAIPATEGAYAARLLGCYEAALSPVIETIIATDYQTVVDIGCAEGYYAVGLARRMPAAKVLARDTNPRARASCHALAALNGVLERVHIGGEWGHKDFGICQSTNTVVICDIEGAEATLLEPAKAPALLCADILVEVHDCSHPGLSDEITKRFAPSHHVRKLDRCFDSDGLPEWMETMSDLDRLTALWEWRAGATPWLWMERRNG